LHHDFLGDATINVVITRFHDNNLGDIEK